MSEVLVQTFAKRALASVWYFAFAYRGNTRSSVEARTSVRHDVTASRHRQVCRQPGSAERPCPRRTWRRTPTLNCFGDLRALTATDAQPFEIGFKERARCTTNHEPREEKNVG